MNKTLLSTLLLCVAFVCHGQRLIHDPNIPVQKSRIILEQMHGGTVTENITDLNYIPLGGGKSDVIDYVSSAVYTKDRIVIVNNEQGHLFIYDGKGTLLKRVSKIDGYKPKNKRVFYNVQKEADKLLLFGEKLKVTLDYDGNVLDKDLDYAYKQELPLIRLKNEDYIYGVAQVKKDSFPEFALKRNDSILVRYDKRDTINSYMGYGPAIVKVSDDKGFAVFSNTYNFFELSPEGITKIHQFVFPLKNTIDTASYVLHRDQQKFIDYLIKNQDKIYAVGQPLVYKEYLILRIASMKMRAWIAYHMETGAILNLNKIMPDKSNDFLELLDSNQLSTDGTYLYSYIFPNSIQRSKDKGRNEEHAMREDYVKLEKSLNPILVRFKLN